MTILLTRDQPGSALPKQVCDDLSRKLREPASLPDGAALVEVAS